MKTYTLNVRRAMDQEVWIKAESAAEAMAMFRDGSGVEHRADGKGIVGYGDLITVDGKTTYRFVKGDE